MSSAKQDLLGRYIDSLQGIGPAPQPIWFNDDGSTPYPGQVEHELKDRFGVYLMQKKLRYDVKQAILKNTDEKQRFNLISLRTAIDTGSGTPEEKAAIAKGYNRLSNDPNFQSELNHILSLVRYG
jgi:hypothetical protein